LILLITTISCESQPSRQTVQPAQDIVDDFISDPSLLSASVGILISDAETGEVIASYHPDKSLVPASTQKLLISSAALEFLGSTQIFRTGLAHSGNVGKNGVLNGDIIIIGSGDPALGSERFNSHYGDIMERLITAISQAGITEINGNILADASIFGRPQIPDTWIWEDIGNYYGSPAFGLNIFDNTYRLTFSSGTPGGPTQVIDIEPVLPGITFQNAVTAAPNNRDNAYIFGSYMSPVREIRGTIPAKCDRFTIKGSIPKPPLQLAAMLTERLNGKGIKVKEEHGVIWHEKDSRKSTTMLEIQSPPLAEIVRLLNQKSINLYAEALLLHLAREKGLKVSVENGCKELTKFWSSKGMDTIGLFLHDASGLSRANGISPAQLGFVLEYMKNHGAEKGAFLASLPASGISGSLKSFAPELPGKFRAKSGYMSRVLNYAGYLESSSGRNLTVVLMVNNHTCSGREMRELWEALVEEVYRNL